MPTPSRRRLRSCANPWSRLQRLVPGDSTRGRRALQVLETSIDRLDHLVNSARRLEETTAELLDPPNQEIDLSNLTQRMLGAYAEAYERRGLKFAARLQPGVVVRAGEDLLETVIENVVDNAVEVSPEGELIDVILERRDGMAKLIVRDRGPGVPAGQLEHIFERYVSLRGEMNGAAQPLAAAETPAPAASSAGSERRGRSTPRDRFVDCASQPPGGGRRCLGPQPPGGGSGDHDAPFLSYTNRLFTLTFR